MNLNIEINPEDINKQIVEAVAKSAIGDSLTQIINEEVKKLSTSYQNPFTNIVSQHIKDLANKIIRENYRDQIEEQLKKILAEKITDEFIDTLWDKLFDKL